MKKMDITGASDPYVKIKLLDSKVGLKPQTIRSKGKDQRIVKQGSNFFIQRYSIKLLDLKLMI